MVELGQVPQKSCQPGIVCARPDKAHAEHCIPGDRGVAVVGELAECIQDWELWVGGGEEPECEGDCSADHRVTITELQGKTELRIDR